MFEKVTWKNLTFMASVILGTVTITSGIIHFFVIANLNERILNLTEDRNTLRGEKNALEKEVITLANEKKTIETDASLPAGSQPRNRLVAGAQTLFRWSYPDHDPLSQSYTIELLNLKANSFSSKRWPVSTPQQRLMYLPAEEIQTGKNLWRVRPGAITDEMRFSHLWSPYYEFYYYPSTLDKIKEEKSITIGIHPIPVAYLQQLDEDGKVTGFNIDLANWLVGKISNRLGIEIKPQFKKIAWKDLFVRLSNREVDIAVGILSASAQREAQFNVSFSSGYRTVHQVLISKTPKQKFPKSLKDMNVGTTNASVNRKAAEYLEDRFEFRVVPRYEDYAGLYLAIENGQVDLGMVDDILVQQYLGNRFFQYGPPLDDYLGEFYLKTLGREKEEYAVAIAGSRKENQELLEIINAVLDSPDGKRDIAKFVAKWINGQ